MTHYAYGEGINYPCVKQERFRSSEPDKLFSRIETFVQENPYIMLWADVGSWTLVVTGDQEHTLEGPLVSQFEVISSYIREILGRPDIFAMDGGAIDYELEE